MSNSVGCVDLSGRKAASDGGAVSKLRNSGAIPLLVSNTPELCLGWETSNLLRGTTNNPYCLSRTPGGSSGGEVSHGFVHVIIPIINLAWTLLSLIYIYHPSHRYLKDDGYRPPAMIDDHTSEGVWPGKEGNGNYFTELI